MDWSNPPFVYVVYGARNASGALRRLARYNFLEVKQPKGLRILREQGLIFSDSTIILFLFGVLVQNLSLFSLVKKNQSAFKVAFFNAKPNVPCSGKWALHPWSI